MRIGDIDLDGPAVLAPMAGYSDARFRLLCREQGAALCFTEMISAEGLMRSVKSTLRLMRIEPDERPTGLQLYGSDPVRMGEAAARSVELVGPDLIDINMGCPARKVVRRGSGVALMRDPDRAVRIVEAVRAAVDCPVTVKIRSGWSAEEITAVELAGALVAAGATALIVHGRTRTQLHSGDADWEVIGRVREAVDVPVIGNGGVASAGDATGLMRVAGTDAVMVGRAAVGNPWVFRGIARGRTAPPTPEELLSAVGRHLDGLIEANHVHGFSRPEQRACSRFRAHLVRYTTGWPGSVAFRRKLNDLVSRESVMAAMDELLDREPVRPLDRSVE